MKKLILTVALCGGAFGNLALAQTVDVKSLDADKEGTTTIEIKKGKPSDPAAPTASTAPKWTTEQGNADVEGEPGATAKDGRAEWKKACEDWKKEFRADNKDNKIVSMNCGSASCSGDAGNKTCTSKATYKIKTKNE
jgi:hypothetical protein